VPTTIRASCLATSRLRAGCARTTRYARFDGSPTRPSPSCRPSSIGCIRTSAGPRFPRSSCWGRAGADALYDSQRAAPHGGDRLQHSVSLVRRARARWPIWSPPTFSKNRDRLLEGDVTAAFFDAVRNRAAAAGLLSDEHFTVDGTPLEAWASLKSFTRRDARRREPPDDPGNPDVDAAASSAPMRRTRRRPIRLRSSIRKPTARSA